MNVPISHLIGTIALLLLIISVASYFVITYSHVQSDILKQQLKEVGEYVLTNLMEIIALLDFSDPNRASNTTIFKILKLQPDLSGYAYAVELDDSEGSFIINLYLISRRDMSLSLKIPINAAGLDVKIHVVKDPPIFLQCEDGGIKSSGIVYSGVRASGEKVVVWGWNGEGNYTSAGIGIWRAK